MKRGPRAGERDEIEQRNAPPQMLKAFLLAAIKTQLKLNTQLNWLKATKFGQEIVLLQVVIYQKNASG